MAKAYVMDKDRGMKSIMRAYQSANHVKVNVGVQSTTGAIAEYAAANEYGTSTIPQRPAIGTAFDENKAKYIRNMERATKRIGTEAFARIANELGIGAKQDIQNTITGRNFLPKLKPATVKAKKGSTKTLVDTGAYVNSIVHVITK